MTKADTRKTQFGKLLRDVRQASGMTRRELADRVRIDPSYIYRIENGERTPSRECVMTLADSLGRREGGVDEWLIAAGFAPITLLNVVRPAIQTRHGMPDASDTNQWSWNSSRWVQALEAMGLHESAVGGLLAAMDQAGASRSRWAARLVRETLTRLREAVAAPVTTAVVPAAGSHHRILASHVMQGLLLRAIREAVESGIFRIVLILAPGAAESLFTPLKEALGLSVFPEIELVHCEQPKSNGLGDALLQAEAEIGSEQFVVLLPDDVVRGRMGRNSFQPNLKGILSASKLIANDDDLIVVTDVTRSKMGRSGVALIDPTPVASKVYSVLSLVEKPALTNPICNSSNVHGIVGRYFLCPGIFRELVELRDQGKSPLHLTDALEGRRQKGHGVYALRLEGIRRDIGEVIDRTNDLLILS